MGLSRSSSINHEAIGVIAMSRFRHLTPIVLVLLALFAVAASTAGAEEKTKVLPEATAAKPITYVFKGGEVILDDGDGAKVKCFSLSGTGSLTSSNHGTYTALLTECTSSLFGATCTGTGDPKGLIASHGEAHFLLALNTESKLVGAIVWLIEKFEFTCATTGISFPVTVEGCVAAKVPSADLNKLIKEGEFDFEGTSPGKPNIASILTVEAKTETACELKSNIDKAGVEESDLVAKVTFGTFKQSGSAVELLLMNPEGL
jgi:hypothetical protein